MLNKFKSNSKYLNYTIIVLGLSTLARLVLAPILGLDGGPSYYAMWSKHLELSYFDHPAMTALLIRLSTEVFGFNSFGIKFPAIILYLLTSIFLYKTIKLYKGSDKGGFIATTLFNFTPWIASSFGIKAANPDVPFLFCYMMVFYFFAKLYNTQKPKYWWSISLFTAFGLLSKYKMIFVYPALIVATFFIKKLRPQFKLKTPYFAGTLALIGIIPTIIWNIQNNFASFGYHLVERQGTFGIKPLQLINFIGNQIAIMGIFIPIILFITIYKERKTNLGKITLSFIAPAIIVFSLATLFFGQSMQNWWASVYMILFVIYGVKRNFNNFDKFILYFTITASILGTVFYAYPFGIRLKETTNFLDHHLFDMAAADLKKIIKEKESKNQVVFVGTPRYRTTAMLNVHLPNQKIYSMDYRKGDQFQIWYPTAELIGKDVIYIAGGSQTKQQPENIFKADKIELIKKVLYSYNPYFSRTFYFYELKNYKGLK